MCPEGWDQRLPQVFTPMRQTGDGARPLRKIGTAREARRPTQTFPVRGISHGHCRVAVAKVLQGGQRRVGGDGPPRRTGPTWRPFWRRGERWRRLAMPDARLMAVEVHLE